MYTLLQCAISRSSVSVFLVLRLQTQKAHCNVQNNIHNKFIGNETQKISNSILVKISGTSTIFFLKNSKLRHNFFNIYHDTHIFFNQPHFFIKRRCIIFTHKTSIPHNQDNQDSYYILTHYFPFKHANIANWCFTI